MILQLTEMRFSFVFNKSPFIVTCMIVFNRETFNYNKKFTYFTFCISNEHECEDNKRDNMV